MICEMNSSAKPGARTFLSARRPRQIRAPPALTPHPAGDPLVHQMSPARKSPGPLATLTSRCNPPEMRQQTGGASSGPASRPSGQPPNQCGPQVHSGLPTLPPGCRSLAHRNDDRTGRTTRGGMDCRTPAGNRGRPRGSNRGPLPRPHRRKRQQLRRRPQAGYCAMDFLSQTQPSKQPTTKTMKPILLTTLTAAFALTATAAEPLKKGDAIPDVAVRNADNQSLAPSAHHQVCQP